MSEDANCAELIRQYEIERGTYEGLASEVKRLLEVGLGQQSVAIHSVTFRAKDRDSLNKKLLQRDPPYGALVEVTDLAAVRITTRFSDDVDRVGKFIQTEFAVDSANSDDKRELLDPDRFGYLSLHYVVSLSSARVSLFENKRYEGRKCEIQVRSILQHAWAEINHDLGYKAAGEVPRQVRRRFARVAGLLELADIEFVGIRDELARYGGEVAQRIEHEPSTVLLDAVSLESFRQTDQTVGDLDRAIAKQIGGSLGDWNLQAPLITGFEALGLSTIEGVRTALQARQLLILNFVDAWASKGTRRRISHGVSLYYLLLVLLAERGDPELVSKSFSYASNSHELLARLTPMFEDVKKAMSQARRS
jgi:putative GTP pyrophosphokinase